ncbi:MAG: hypothetical protein H7Z17_17075 [Fuerstia sp.]|nr:hypothetical protein [Fuerstiella sp.]
MPYQLSADIERLVEDRIATGAYSNPEEVLQAALETLQQSDADLAKIQEAIDEWQAGDEGLPLNEAFVLIHEGRIDC